MAKPPTKRSKSSAAKPPPKNQTFLFPSPILRGFVNLLWHEKKLQIRLYSLPGNGYEIRIEDEGIAVAPPRQFKALSQEQIAFLTPIKPGILDNPDISVLPQEIRDYLDQM